MISLRFDASLQSAQHLLPNSAANRDECVLWDATAPSLFQGIPKIMEPSREATIITFPMIALYLIFHAISSAASPRVAIDIQSCVTQSPCSSCQR